METFCGEREYEEEGINSETKPVEQMGGTILS